jgi:hypothetical protein
VCGTQVVPLDPAPRLKQFDNILDNGCRVSVGYGKEKKTQVDYIVLLFEFCWDFVEDIPVVEAVDVAGTPGWRWEAGEVDVDSIEDGIGELVCRIKKPEACSCGNVGDAWVISDCISDCGMKAIAEALFPDEVLVV